MVTGRSLGLRPLPQNADSATIIRYINELSDFVAKSSKEDMTLRDKDFGADIDAIDQRLLRIEGDLYGTE